MDLTATTTSAPIDPAIACTGCGKEERSQASPTSQATAFLGEKCQEAMAREWGSKPDQQNHAALAEARRKRIEDGGRRAYLGKDGGIVRGPMVRNVKAGGVPANLASVGDMLGDAAMVGA